MNIDNSKVLALSLTSSNLQDLSNNIIPSNNDNENKIDEKIIGYFEVVGQNARNFISLINDNIQLIGVNIKEITTNVSNKCLIVSTNIGANIIHSKDHVANVMSSLISTVSTSNSTIYNGIVKVYNNITNSFSKLLIFSAKKEAIVLYKKKTRKPVLYIDTDEDYIKCEADLIRMYDEIIKKDINQNRQRNISDNYRWIRYIYTNILNNNDVSNMYTIKLLDEKSNKNISNNDQIDNDGGEVENIIGVLVWRKNDSNCVKIAQNHCYNGMKHL